MLSFSSLADYSKMINYIKPKVLIVLPSFDSGGTVTSLINFVTLVDKSKYDLFVFAITNTGANRKYIEDKCTIIGGGGTEKSIPTIRQKVWDSAFCIVKKIKKIIEKVGIDISPILFRYYARKLDNGKYDFVIAFQEGQATRFVGFFNHGFKIAWVRSEYSRFVKLVNKNYSKIYDKYDRIVSVSKASLKSFLTELPQYKDISVVQYNFLNDERIIALSEEAIESNETTEMFTIVSVGRIDPIKNFSMIPEIANYLTRKGLVFRWLIIGGVAVKKEFELLEKNKRKFETDNVLLLGNKSNPYPYIKKSNILVCLSSSETFNNTLTEAKILGVPVVTTDYPCAYESIKNGEEGIICPVEEIKEVIYKIMLDVDDIYSQLKCNLKQYKYNNGHLLNHLYNTVLTKPSAK